MSIEIGYSGNRLILSYCDPLAAEIFTNLGFKLSKQGDKLLADMNEKYVHQALSEIGDDYEIPKVKKPKSEYFVPLEDAKSD